VRIVLNIVKIKESRKNQKKSNGFWTFFCIFRPRLLIKGTNMGQLMITSQGNVVENVTAYVIAMEAKK
jgi:hypothetical protein